MATFNGVVPVVAGGVARQHVADAAAQQLGGCAAHQVEIDEHALGHGVAFVADASSVAQRGHPGEACVHRWQLGDRVQRHAATPVQPLAGVHR